MTGLDNLTSSNTNEPISNTNEPISNTNAPASNNNDQTIDQSTHKPSPPDPYAIYPSDNPTLVLFSPLLQGDNYPTWVRGMSKALNAKAKLGFVDGSISPPKDDPIMFDCWKRCDDLVGSWILNSVHQDIRPSCIFSKSAHELWKDLHVRFSHSNGPKLFQLKSAIANLKQESMPVTTYYTRLKSLWDEYDSLVPSAPCICGASKFLIEKHERDRAMELLQGLHDRFSSLRSQILLHEPMPSALRIFSYVLQEEEQQSINSRPLPSIQSAALYAGKNHASSYRSSQYHPGSSSSSTNKRQRPFCDHCNIHGHTRKTCYKIHGYPDKSVTPKANMVSVPSVDTNAPSIISSLTPAQCARLMELLKEDDADTNMTPRVNNLSGPFNEESDW
ncbi:hypothetical protein ACHQM5_021007 [Ranunculus cassubicifolius]